MSGSTTSSSSSTPVSPTGLSQNDVINTSSSVIPVNKKRHPSHESAFSLTPPTHKLPGHIEREMMDDWVAPPRPLTEEEVRKLDEECHERFVKLTVTYMSSAEQMEEIPGVLLVTPDAVMFDPDENDPLVVQNGLLLYSMVVPMDSIASVSVYHDADNMKRRRNQVSSHRVNGSASTHVSTLNTADTLNTDDMCNDVSENNTSVTCDPVTSCVNTSQVIDISQAGNGSTQPQQPASEQNGSTLQQPSCVSKASDKVETGEDSQNENNSEALVGERPETLSIGLVWLDEQVTAVSEYDVTCKDKSKVDSPVTLNNITCEHPGLEVTNDASTPLIDLNLDAQSECNNENHSGLSLVDKEEIGYGGLEIESPRVNTGDVMPGLITCGDVCVPDVDENTPVQDIVSGELSTQTDTTEQEQRHERVRGDGKKSSVQEALPVYLCLGVRVHVDTSKNFISEASIHTAIKPVYWYSIPYDKVDHVYAFFLQWTPDLTDDHDPSAAVEQSFVVIDNLSDWTVSDDTMAAPSEDSKRLRRSMSKDWEIVNIKELRRRVSQLEIAKLPLPELSQPSSVFDETHLRTLIHNLPARAEGSRWSLVYSSERNGFSLRTLYRCMQGVDSPTLLILKDNNHKIFGALLSCAIRQSDHFYGNGESYLFTFYPEFKKYNWTGINSFFVKGNGESLCVGASEGANGLWFDSDLYHGRTQTCLTFENELLTVTQDFVIDCIETWCFI